MNKCPITITKNISTTVHTTVETNDVFNWLTACDDPEVLEYLGKYALRQAKNIRNPDNDDFRSRA